MRPFASTGPQGHRSRMRAKLLDRGADALADYELVEMLLFLGTPRGDTKPFAKQLMNQFGSLDGLLAASPDRLERAGLTAGLRTLVDTVVQAARRLTSADAEDRPHLSTVETIAAHLRRQAAGPGLVVLHLNNRNRLLRQQSLPDGMPPEQAARAMGEEAVRHHASAAVLVAVRAGRPRCLPQDRRVLAACQDAGQALSIVLHDYLVLGSASELSLRQTGQF